MKKLVALLLSVMMCFACVSALADTYVSWYTYGDVYLSSVRSEMEADFAKLNLTINGSDANGNQQVQSDFISTALMNNDCEAIVVNLVESGAISTAQTIMNQIQAAGIPTVWFNRPVSARVEYRWLCPYCERQVSTQSAVYPADYERLETGGFYDTLECPSCGKTADVRYWKTTRID